MAMVILLTANDSKFVRLSAKAHRRFGSFEDDNTIHRNEAVAARSNWATNMHNG